MPGKPQYITGWFLPVDEGAHPEHPIVIPPPDLGNPGDPPTIWPDPVPIPHPEHPIVLPPLSGVWPPPGRPTHPIYYPGKPTHPIWLEPHPEHPIVIPPAPPDSIDPPLCCNPLPKTVVAVLIQIVGTPGYRWLVLDNSKK